MSHAYAKPFSLTEQRFVLNLSNAESNVGRLVENCLFKATYIYFYIVFLLLTSLLTADIFSLLPY